MAERPLSAKMQAVLVALLDEDEKNGRAMTANAVGSALGYEAGMAKHGRSGRGHSTRVMGVAVHVTTTLTALRVRGLVDFGSRPDGLTGTAFMLTEAGEAEARRARAEGIHPRAPGFRRPATDGEEQAMGLDERIEKVKQATGYVEEDEPVEEFEGFGYGDRVRVLADDDEEGVFEGDEGFAVPCYVGGEEYGNRHVALFFLPDGFSSPVQVAVDAVEPI